MVESSFFATQDEDDALEHRNAVFWEAMLNHIRRDGFARPPQRVLDVGCHRGGLLARIAAQWGANELIGIEPIQAARSRAQLRLKASAPRVQLLSPEQWCQVPGGAVDLVVCHEVLFMLSDLDEFAAHLARVIAPQGRAYIAAGCHAENPVWPVWKSALEAEGKQTFTHEPISLMAAAGRQGFLAGVRPLRESGWAIHNPVDSPFTFPSVSALLDHQFRHKLLFRLVRK
jgi:SAM-dependent methyltransferase